MRVPGEDRKFLMKQHELLWTEVTASNLVKVDMDEGPRRAAPASIGQALRCTAASCVGGPNVNCAVHVHTRIGMAMAGLQERPADDLAGGRALLRPYRLSPL